MNTFHDAIHSLTTQLGAYNGSKAALVAASETWRYELQPLGVRTITLITCATKTQYFNNVEGAKIPETSKYYEVRGLVHGLTDGHLQAGAISARQYATKVVREVEKGTVGTVWAGTNALINRLTLWLSPQLLMVSIGPKSYRTRCLTKIAGHGIREHCSSWP